MTNYDEQLQQLRQQVSRRNHLENTLRELRSQQKELSARVSQLETVKISEQADVDRLEGRSLAAFFYNVVGKMDEKLDQERQEAYAAAVKYDAAYRELLVVNDDIRFHEEELSRLADCQAQYDALLTEKLELLKRSGTAAADEIFAKESRITYLEQQMDEIDEAIAAGNYALNAAQMVMSSLDSAQGWGTFDLLGGGLLADMAKHSHLDDAQRKIEQLQIALRRFKTELADVASIQVTAQVNIDGFLRFADYFFDNLFTDWAVMDKISQSKGQVNDTIHQVRNVMTRLNGMMAADQAEWKRLHDEIDSIVLNTKA